MKTRDQKDSGRFNQNSDTPLLSDAEDAGDFQLFAETPKEAAKRDQAAEKAEADKLERAREEARRNAPDLPMEENEANVVTPSLRAELKKAGVKVEDGDRQYSLRKHQQVNPIVVNGQVQAEYADLLENKEYTPETISEWDQKAIAWIARQGGIEPAAEMIANDTEHSDRHVATLVQKHVLNSEFASSLPDDIRIAVELKNLDEGTAWGREGVAAGIPKKFRAWGIVFRFRFISAKKTQKKRFFHHFGLEILKNGLILPCHYREKDFSFVSKQQKGFPQ